MFHVHWIIKPIFLKMFKCQTKYILKCYCGFKIYRHPYWDWRKQPQFNHNASTPLLFVNNTKLQLHKSYNVKPKWKLSGYKIKYNTNTNTLYVLRKKIHIWNNLKYDLLVQGRYTESSALSKMERLKTKVNRFQKK